MLGPLELSLGHFFYSRSLNNARFQKISSLVYVSSYNNKGTPSLICFSHVTSDFNHANLSQSQDQCESDRLCLVLNFYSCLKCFFFTLQKIQRLLRSGLKETWATMIPSWSVKISQKACSIGYLFLVLIVIFILQNVWDY